LVKDGILIIDTYNLVVVTIDTLIDIIAKQDVKVKLKSASISNSSLELLPLVVQETKLFVPTVPQWRIEKIWRDHVFNIK